jgi:hypothetical protein
VRPDGGFILGGVDDSFRIACWLRAIVVLVILPHDPGLMHIGIFPMNIKEELRSSRRLQQLALRLFDVTDLDLGIQSPYQRSKSMAAMRWLVTFALPVSDREYSIEIGYRTWDGRWLKLALIGIHACASVVYPSDWVEDPICHFGLGRAMKAKVYCN